MLSFFTITVFATFLSIGVSGQSSTIDSLLRLVTIEKEDTSKISLYIKLGDCLKNQIQIPIAILPQRL